MAIFLRCLNHALAASLIEKEGSLSWDRRSFEATGREYCGLDWRRNRDRYGYCWIKPVID